MSLHTHPARCRTCDGTGRDIPPSCRCWASPSFVGIHSCAVTLCPDCDGLGVAL